MIILFQWIIINININNKIDKNFNDTDNNKNKLSILNNIKSAYILNTIFNYIDNENYPYILFKYSKFFQNKFKKNYKERYQELLFLKDISEVKLNSPLFEQKIANNTIYILLRNHGYMYLKEIYNDLLEKNDIKSIYFFLIIM